MPVGAAIGGIVGGGISAGGAYLASKTQSDAAGKALDAQKSLFDQTQANMKPFIDTGKGALYSLAQLYGIKTPDGAGGEAYNDNALAAFRKSPDYDWRLKEGTRALDFSASSKGTLGSRGHLNNTVAFGQGLASQGLGDYTGRLLSLAQIGANSAGTAGGQATSQGQILGNTLMGQGQANASGWVGGTNALNGAIGGTGNNLLLYNALNNRSAYGGGGGSSSAWGGADNALNSSIFPGYGTG